MRDIAFQIQRVAFARCGAFPLPFFLILLFCGPSFLFGAGLDDARKAYLKGDYEKVIQLAEEASKPGTGDDTQRLNAELRSRYGLSPQNRLDREEWMILGVKSALAVGKYEEAAKMVTEATDNDQRSIRLRILAHEVFLENGDTKKADSILEEINSLGTSRMSIYRDPPNMVALGQAALLLGADPKLVLEIFFNQAKSADPKLRDAYLAIGRLSLDKGDHKLAADAFQEGLKQFSDDPDMLFGLAKAFSASDRSQMGNNLNAALSANPRHVPSLLLYADHLIDAEDYKKAEETVDKVLAINPAQPEAWAYRAMMAHLDNKLDEEKNARASGLKHWKTNPKVDHIIGTKLSQKYRFSEGSAYQRQALEYDPRYLPAKIQLAQDLLRLGEDAEGWRLVSEVQRDDGYDVLAYNLATLHDGLSKFAVLTNEHFIVRMSPREADIYGDRVLGLLEKARTNLCAKYGMELERATVVEIFPEQKDFAIRTFGMPGGEGYLGVCFGCVITANSPAAQGPSPANWEAVLWHEFCHVVTLAMTRNKMPRWLSEGISVYEERQANPTWGQWMKPDYRERILNGKLTPVADLSSAFLKSEKPSDIQFAYYQSSLVVEFIVQQFGLNSIKSILQDLGKGEPINDAIARHTAPMKEIEKDFAAFARVKAETLASELEWSQPPKNATDLTAWANRNPKNFWALIQQARNLVENKKWEEAKAPLNTLLENYPENIGPASAYALLALAHRNLNETEQEEAVLKRWAALDPDATDAFSRLMELASARGDWTTVAKNGERFLATNPLVATPYRYLARAHEESGNVPQAIRAYRVQLLLEPPNPADVHFRLARLLHSTGDKSAKRHVLAALEEAPRFREAHRLLLAINHNGGTNQPVSDDVLKPAAPPAPTK